MASPIDIATETKIVALLARGDTYTEIQGQIEGGVSLVTIGAVKKRNKENLMIIAEKMAIKAAEDASSIKLKANKLISARLDVDGLDQEVLDHAKAQYLADEISWATYERIVNKSRAASITELVTVSKEMHHQSAEGDTPPANASDLAALAAAIRSGDSLKITQLVFGNDNSPPVS